MPKAIVLLVEAERMVRMDKRRKIFATRVENILYRDYIGGKQIRSRWVETVLQRTNLEDLFLSGYTEEAAAQKIFEENCKLLKPEMKSNRLNSGNEKQEVSRASEMKTFQVLVKKERQYSRLSTETARMLFDRIMQALTKRKNKGEKL